jgi:hypothetical protein
MRSAFLTALFLSLFSTFTVQATNDVMPFEKPEDLLARAKVGRHEYIDVIYQIRNYFFVERSKEELYQYLGMITELEKIETAHKFPIFEVRPVQMLAEKLTEISAEKISFFDDSVELVETFIRWSLEEKKYELIEQQALRLRKEHYSEESLKNALILTRHFLDMNNPDEPYPSYLVERSKDLEGYLLKRLLMVSTLTNPSLQPLVADIRGLYAISALMSHYLNELTDGNQDIFTQEAINLILMAAKKAQQFDPHNDDLSLSNVSSVAAKFFMAYLAENKEASNANELIELVRESEYNELFAFFQFFNFNEMQSSKTPISIALLEKIVEFYKQYSPVRFEYALYKLNSLKVINVPFSIQGQYEVSLGRVNGLLTIYKTLGFGLSFMLVTENGQFLGQGNFSYMRDDGSVKIASEEPFVNGTLAPKKYLQISLYEGKLVGQFVSGRTKLTFSGKKIQELELTSEAVIAHPDMLEEIIQVRDGNETIYELDLIQTSDRNFRAELNKKLPNSNINLPIGFSVMYADGMTYSFFSDSNEANQSAVSILTLYTTAEGRFLRYFSSHLKTSKVFKLE